MFIAEISSCHALIFLHLATTQEFQADIYEYKSVADDIRARWEGKSLTNREFYFAEVWDRLPANDLLMHPSHVWHKPQVIKLRIQ